MDAATREDRHAVVEVLTGLAAALVIAGYAYVRWEDPSIEATADASAMEVWFRSVLALAAAIGIVALALVVPRRSRLLGAWLLAAAVVAPVVVAVVTVWYILSVTS